MFKKIIRSIHGMPRAAYIFLRNTLVVCDVLLICSLCLFISSESAVDSYETAKLAWLTLETPAGLLFIALFGFILILDRS